MIGPVVFLVEEDSMKLLLEGLLPRIHPELPFVCLSHQGKLDLDRSIPRKLKAYRTPGARFVVLRDQDHADCFALKRRLRQTCIEAGREDAVVRIACRELEAWYIGDLEALEAAFGLSGIAALAKKARFRDPDSVTNPSAEIRKLVPGFRKMSGARRMAAALRPERNRSRGFRHLMTAIDRLGADAIQPDRATR